MAISLCADCFAVSLCSGVTLKKIEFRSVAKVAAAFAVIQTGLLVLGWLLGSAVAGLVFKAAHIIGFLLLLYVGGSMLVEGIKGEEEVKNLDGLKNIVLGGIATSIDALAVGVSQSLATGVSKSLVEGVSQSPASQQADSFITLAVSVFVVTAASVVAGIAGGKVIGRKFGRWAEIAGGLVLIIIALRILL